MTPEGETFLNRLAELYGNPSARFFDGGRLEPQQRVKILVGDHCYDAVAMGKNFNKKKYAGKGHWIRYTDHNGRKWELRLNANQILIKW
jgi:hypothetical protein